MGRRGCVQKTWWEKFGKSEEVGGLMKLYGQEREYLR